MEETIQVNNENVVETQKEEKKSNKKALIISLCSVFLSVIIILVAVLSIFLNKEQEVQHNLFEKGLVAVRTEDGWGYMNKKGELVIKAQFEEAYPFADNGLALVSLDGFYGYINTKGKYEINPIYTEAHSFDEDESKLALVKRNAKYGYIDKSGEEVIPCQFEEAYNFTSERALVKMAGKYGFIDESGKFVINPTYVDASGFSKCGLAVVGKVGNADVKRYAVINKKGELLNDFHYFNIYIGEKYLITYDGLFYIVRDSQMKELFKTEYQIAGFEKDFIRLDSFENIEDKLIPFRDINSHKFGYLNLKGEVVISAEYDLIGNFYDDMAKVLKDGKYGFINTDGELIVNNSYTYTRNYNNGYAVVANDALYGLIDKNGKIVLEVKYAVLGDVYNDVCYYKAADSSTYGYYNVKKSSFICEAIYSEVSTESNVFDCTDDGYIVVRQGDYFGVINKKGKYIINPYLLDISF